MLPPLTYRGFPFGLVLSLSLLGCQSQTPAESAKSSAAQYDGFVHVQGGAFQMGDLWGDSPWAMGEPVHDVEVGDFLLAKHEVTVGQFGKFVAATGHKTVPEAVAGTVANRGMIRDGKQWYPCWRDHFFPQPPDHPVVLVAWEDAIAYCNWLSQEHHLPPAYDLKTGKLLAADGQPTQDIRLVKGFRLPTEAEWEFAARERGRKVRFCNGQDIARAGEINFDAAGTGPFVPSLRPPKGQSYAYCEKGITRDVTTPVGSFPPNALGLHDMSGNAWEWCTDTGGFEPTQGRHLNPVHLTGQSHVLRGGNYGADAKACRASARIDWHPGAFCTASGFRVALTAD